MVPPFPTPSLALLLAGAALLLACAALAVGLVRRPRVRRRRLGRLVAEAKQLGPYRLGRRLGEGGMGTVFEAQHLRLGRRAAVKVVKPTRSARDDELEQEAVRTGALSHPNTVALYDFGQTADGLDYYAMELVDGITLHQLVERYGPLPAARVLDITRQIAASLAHAHGHGLIHRDIKPANVMLCHHDGHPDHVKVLDFGLAARAGALGHATGLTVGTPAYMAPESFCGSEHVGPAADVYSVGVLAYQLLTGAVPFDGRSTRAIAYRHLSEPPLPPSLRAPDGVPADLEYVVLRCLAKHDEERYADGAALLDALWACAPDASWSRRAALHWWQRENERPVVSRCASIRDSATRPLELRRPLQRASAPPPAGAGM